MINLTQRADRHRLVCPYCKDDLAELPAIECSRCGVGHHRVCAEELSECATAGCSAALLPNPAPEPQPVVFRERPSGSIDWSLWAPALMVGGCLILFPLGLWIVTNVRTSTLERVAPYVTLGPIVALVVLALGGMLVGAIRERS